MGQGEVAEAPATEIAPLRNVRIVLVRPRGAANVGAAARAMKNIGRRATWRWCDRRCARLAAAESHGGARARPRA